MTSTLKLLIPIFILMIVSGCKTNDSKARLITDLHWQRLYIDTHSFEISISNYDDSLTYKLYSNFKDSFSGSKMFYFPTDIDSGTIKISDSEADTIFDLVKDLITNPVQVTTFCTDYVDHLELSIDYIHNFSQACRYQSLCEWSTISPKTIKLDSIFSKYVKINKK